MTTRPSVGEPMPLEVDSSTAALQQQLAGLTEKVARHEKTIESLTRRLELLQAHAPELSNQLAASAAHEVNMPTQYIADNVSFLQRAFDKLWKLLEAQGAVIEAVRAGNDVSSQALDLVDSARVVAKLDYLARQVPRAIEQSLAGLGQVTSIVRALKEFAHPRASEPQPVDIHDVIESTTVIAKSEWKYVADLELAFDWSLPPVLVRRRQLSQVLLDLLVNAAHAIAASLPTVQAEKGKLLITTKGHAKHVEIRISDSAGAIPDAIRARLFDASFGAAASAAPGTREGLAATYAIAVNELGGALTCEAREGQGTTFVLALPLAVP